MRTPSQATIRNSSSSPRVVSVVYGEPTTNSFIDESPNDLVTAKTPVRSRRVLHQLRAREAQTDADGPLTRLFMTNPPASVIRLAS